jgi:hypothetical protein
MSIDEVLSTCKRLHDDGRRSVMFRRIDGGWEMEEKHGDYLDDEFAIVLWSILVMNVGGALRKKEFQSFRETLEAAERFMRDYEE